MNPQEYIMSQLNSLKVQFESSLKSDNSSSTVDNILHFLYSKKFRKFSIPTKNQLIIKEAIEKNIASNEPIKIVFPFGGYKLWRLDETPETDWAELFSLIYFANWLKPVCAVYPKGVTFTFWFDEVVIGKMNNISQEDLEAYKKSFNDLLLFMEKYIPSNMRFESFYERSRYQNNEVFQSELEIEIDKLKRVRELNPQVLSQSAIRSIEMNVKVTSEQEKDPLWREKIDIMHNAYYNLQEKNKNVRLPYSQENITAFTIFFEPNVIPIGSAKTSIVRFWVGVGVLQRREDAYIENILSVTQLEKAKFTLQQISINGLDGKNFKRIRILG